MLTVFIRATSFLKSREGLKLRVVSSQQTLWDGPSIYDCVSENSATSA